MAPERASPALGSRSSSRAMCSNMQPGLSRRRNPGAADQYGVTRRPPPRVSLAAQPGLRGNFSRSPPWKTSGEVYSSSRG